MPFPELRVLATGSSTLAATHKFRDSLTGRKRAVELVPVLPGERGGCGVPDLEGRLLRGRLPPALLGADAGFYTEWLDSPLRGTSRSSFARRSGQSFCASSNWSCGRAAD